MPVPNKLLSEELEKINAKIAFLQGCVRGLSDRLHTTEISTMTLAKGLQGLENELREFEKSQDEKFAHLERISRKTEKGGK